MLTFLLLQAVLTHVGSEFRHARNYGNGGALQQLASKAEAAIWATGDRVMYSSSGISQSYIEERRVHAQRDTGGFSRGDGEGDLKNERLERPVGASRACAAPAEKAEAEAFYRCR